MTQKQRLRKVPSFEALPRLLRNVMVEPSVSVPRELNELHLDVDWKVARILGVPRHMVPEQ